MLTRIITALILAPLALGAIYLLPPVPFALVIVAIVGLAAFEWAGLVLPAASPSTSEPSLARNPYTRIIVSAVFVSACVAFCAWLWLNPGSHSQWLLSTAVCWVWAVVEVLIYPRQVARGTQFRWVVFGLIALPGAWLSMLTLRAQDPHLLVLACFLVWGADAGAYFAGKALGRRKLAPNVSPGKTWEGAVGGAITGLLVAAVFGVLLVPGVSDRLGWVLLVLVGLVIISVFGDLFESILKRTAGAKDSGQLLPGHGGILDRVDALIAVLPFMALLAANFAIHSGVSAS